MAGSSRNDTETLTEDGPPPAEAGVERLWLQWCHPLPARAPLALEAAKHTLGRDPSCDAHLPSGHVSRFHAEIRRSGPVFAVFDRDSKNGVLVNGARVTQAVLKPGDVLRVGDHVAVVVSATADDPLVVRPVLGALWGGHRHRALAARALELAVSPLPLVLQGATGTGKELLARAIHEASGRRGEFLGVNSALYSRTTAAAELFGVSDGAGQNRARPGHVRAADGGTLFLDEVLELPLDVQAMWLRVLEQNAVQPVGESRPLPVDVRVLVATQQPLAEAVATGRFRADLRARLEGAVLELPRLASCREIVPELLVELHRRRGAAVPLELSAAAAEGLCLHDWPLNVRELDMLAGRLAARTSPRRVELAELELPPAAVTSPRAEEGGGGAPGVAVPGRRPSSTPYDPAEVQRLREALERHAGNVSRAVAELGISRQRAYRMLPQLKLSS
ncbi:MAG TPA: sigma 54-interacting transcriptional regulator [Polyangiaceae bacterium]|jgi:transcriptional regulator of acetoin/glycerol metabolism|nr:sigma 54-interacting transcriptional regulator [Polyangiaceae bacterium]